MKKFIFTLLFSLIFGINARAQTFEATVNRNPVPQGEAFVLSLELKDGQTNMTPDFSVLNKDFQVYSVGNATNIQVINGKRRESRPVGCYIDCVPNRRLGNSGHHTRQPFDTAYPAEGS